MGALERIKSEILSYELDIVVSDASQPNDPNKLTAEQRTELEHRIWALNAKGYLTIRVQYENRRSSVIRQQGIC